MGVFDFLPDDDRQRAIDALAARSGAPPLLQSPDAPPVPAAPAGVPDAMTPEKLVGFMDTMRQRYAPRAEDAAELASAQQADRKQETLRGLESGFNRAASLTSGTHQAGNDLPLPKNVLEFQQQKALRDAKQQAAAHADAQALALMQAAPKITAENLHAQALGDQAPYVAPKAKAEADLAASHAKLYGTEATSKQGEADDKERWRQALIAGDSSATKVARGLASKLMPSMAQQIEAANGAELVPLLPLMEKAYGAEQMAQFRAASLADRKEGRAAGAEKKAGAADAKTEKEAITRLDKADTDMNEAKSSSRNGLGVANSIVARGGRIMALLGKGTTKEELDKISPQWVKEAAAGMAAIATGGNSPALETMKEMTPNGIGMGSAWWEQWISNRPVGASQGAFLQQMAATIKREDEAARAQILASHLKTVSRVADLKDHPNFQRLVRTYQLGPHLDESGAPREDVMESLARGEAPGGAKAGGGEAPKKATHRFNTTTGKIEALP